MAIKPDYMAGTITVAANGTVVTGVGSQWVSADIQPGDTLKVKNLDAVIATVTSNTSITLTEPWTGGALSASAYRIRYQPDGSRFTAALRDLVTAIGGGSLAALQAVTGAANKLPYFNSASTMDTTDLTVFGRTLIGASSVLAQLAALGLPEQLAANRTYYVRKDGSDTNNGLADTAGGAFLTINKAINAIYESTDSRTYSNSIIVRAGTYAEGINLAGLPANSGSRAALKFPIFLIGNTTTPSSIIITGGGNNCVLAAGGARLDIHGFKLSPSNLSSYGIYTIDPGTHVNFGNMDFGATNVDHVASQSGSLVTFDANYTISGGALNHWHATEGGNIKAPGTPITITLLNTPAWAGQFAGCGVSSCIFAPNLTFSGAATGKRYLSHYNGGIRTNTDNKNYFPGNSPGVQMAGGQFDYPPSFTAHKNGADQTGIAAGVDTLVTFPTATITGGGYDITPANSSFQPRGGKCMITANVTFTAGLVDQNIMGIGIYKNGAPFKYSWASCSGAGVQGVNIAVIDNCNGDDVYQVYARCDGAGTRTIGGGSSFTWWQGSQL